MAMLPFCGYNMADYWSHWLGMGERAGAGLPAVFYVNWFRKDADGRFIWPGFGENSRVLKWIFERCEGSAEAVDTAIGQLPGHGALDIGGLDVQADGGTHVASTAEVGRIRIVGHESKGRINKRLRLMIEDA